MNYREKCLKQKLNFCRVCGASDNLEVHHKDGDRTNNSLSNLTPVCNECHSKIHSKQDATEPIKELRQEIEYEENTQHQYAVMLTQGINRDMVRHVDSTPELDRASFIRTAIRHELARIGYDEYEIPNPSFFNYMEVAE